MARAPAVRTASLLPGEFAGREAWAREVARVTRAAFGEPGRRGGDVPPPTGSQEPDLAPLEDLERGGRVWVARAGNQDIAGIVRAVPAGDAAWELKRLGVVPAYRGRGVARLLVRRVEREAVRAGVARLLLHCVVERLLPPFYASLGYRIVRRDPHPEKPLTVVTMERDPAAARRPYGTAWDAERALPGKGVYVLWLWLDREWAAPVPIPTGALLAPGLYAYVGSAQAHLAARVDRHVRGTGRLSWHVDHLRRQADAVGVDVGGDWPRSGECELAAALAEAAVPGGKARRVMGFGSSDCRCMGHLVHMGDGDPWHTVPFALPRRFDPRLLAIYRPAFAR